MLTKYCCNAWMSRLGSLERLELFVLEFLFYYLKNEVVYINSNYVYKSILIFLKKMTPCFGIFWILQGRIF